MDRMRVGRLAAIALAAGVIAAGGGATGLAQDDGASSDVEIGLGAPVELHDGTCEDPNLRPDYQLGTLRRQPFDASDILEGEDRNDNGVLDEDEIVAAAAVHGASVYRTEGEVDAGFEELFGSPEIIAVHRSAKDYGTLIACGELSTGADPGGEDEVLVPIRPVGDSGYRGFAVFERDTGGVPIFGEERTGVTVYLFEGLTTLFEERLARATPTP
jgi:hypothetical protein